MRFVWKTPVTRAVALAAVLLLPAFARADAALFPPLPGGSHVPIVYTFTIEQDNPEWEFWLVWHDGSSAERLPVSATNPVRVSAVERKREPSPGIVFALPKWLSKTYEGKSEVDFEETRRWVTNGAVFLDHIRTSRELPFYDNREQVEITYRIEFGPRMVEVSENRGDAWYRWSRLVSVCFLFPLGLALLGFWARRRLTRRRARDGNYREEPK